MLAPAEYFAKYGEHLSESETPYEAWLKTERDFYKLYALRRFVTYSAFREAHRLFRAGQETHRITLHVVEIKIR